MGSIGRRAAATFTAAASAVRRGRRRRSRAMLERLERRYLYSAGWDVVLVDATLPDAATLAEALTPSITEQTRVVTYDGRRQSAADVLDDLADWAEGAGHTLRSVSLLSHAAPGEFELGDDLISHRTLDETAPAWRRLGEFLEADGRIDLYGCDLAASADGLRLMNDLAGLTGADVYASTDLTGRGGDWVLEAASSGAPQAARSTDAAALADWSGTLAIPLTGEVLVNETVNAVQQTSAEGHKSVAVTSTGEFIVVWAGSGSGDTDGVFARRFDANGAPLGPEFRVNVTVAGAQITPAVAVDGSGNFVVAWASQAQDGTGFNVYARRFNAAGTALAAEFRVNSTTANDQTQPSVAMNSAGTFVVAWTSAGQDGSGTGVVAQRYNASGVAQGSELLVNSAFTDGNQQYARVAVDSAGGFVVVWQTQVQFTGSVGIFLRRYNAAGVAQNNWELVNTTTDGFQQYPAIGMNAGGQFVVAWTSDTGDGTGNGLGVYFQRFNAAGAKQGGETRANATIPGDQQMPSVAVDDSGAFVIAWQGGGAGASADVYLREFTAAGVASGGESVVNVTTSGGQAAPSVTVIGPTARYVVAWSGSGTGDADGVFARRFARGSPGSFTVTPTSGLQTSETGTTSTFTVVLSQAPTSNVVVSLSSSDPTEATLSATTLTFTTANWNVPQTVTVTGVNDPETDGDMPFTVVTAAAVSADPAYNNVDAADVTGVNYDNDGLGLKSTYYDNADFTAPRIVRIDPTIDFNWQYAVPDPAIGGETFSVRWVGEICPRYTETYTFYTTSDDGVRLWVNGQLVVQNWTNHAATTNTGTITLNAGQWYSIRMDFYENTEIAVARLEWSSASQAREVVPASRLRPTNATPASANDAYTVGQGGVLSPAGPGVLANDTDADGDLLTATLVSGPSHGTLTLNANGSFTYTPDPKYVGTDSFSYVAGDGLASTGVATVTITIPRTAGVTITPTAGLVTTEWGGTASFSVVLDGAPTQPVAIQLVSSNPTEGNVSQTVLVFDAGNWTMPQTVVVTGVNDGVADGDVGYAVVATVSSIDPRYDGLSLPAVSLTNLHLPVPTATDDRYSTRAGETLTVTDNAGVLRNDGDPSKRTLAAVLVEGPSRGTLTLLPGGGFAYTPAAGFSGTDRFVYAAQSDVATSEPAEVRITVTPVDPVDPPDDPGPDDPDDPGPGGPGPDGPGPGPGDPLPPVEPVPPKEPPRDPPAQPEPPSSGPNLPSPPRPQSPPDEPVEPTPPTPGGEGPVQPPVNPSDPGETPDPPPTDDPGKTPPAPVTRVASASLSVRLDAMARQMGSRGPNEPMSVKAVRHTFVAITVGYVVWSLRGASLLASLLTSMPLWRTLDPLPILENRAKVLVKKKKRRQDRDDDRRRGERVDREQPLGEMVK